MAMLGISERPISFKSIIGQKKIVEGIQRGISTNTLSNVILFCGPSGVGKSTLARLVAMTLNCENPVKTEDGLIEPCGQCKHCKDIIEGRYNLGTSSYNGNEINADSIKEIEEDLSYNSQFSKHKILIFEEIQNVTNTAKMRFKNILESPQNEKNGVYILMTTTDENQYKSSYDKANSSREKNAIRGRLAFYNLSNVTIDDISNYLFEVYTNKLDPNGDFDEGLELIPYIAQNACGSVRTALNDLQQMFNMRAFDKDELFKILGYTDEEKEAELVNSLLFKDKTVLHYIKEHTKDLEGNFPYWYSILSSLALRDMLDEPFEQEYKEKNYQRCKKSGNIQNLFRAFNETQQLCGTYFNSNVFISKIYEYYNGTTPKVVNRLVENVSNTENNSAHQPTVVKKVKKIV